MSTITAVTPHDDLLPAPPATEILRTEVGSTVHGIGIGSDDLDLMSVAIEPQRAITGLGNWDHWTWRTADKDARSGPDDIDWVMYGLRKYLRLAIKGNPSILVMLYAPAEMTWVLHEAGQELLEMRESIVSQACIPRFLGYLGGQRKRAQEGKGTGRGSNEGRQAKWASHMVRLGYQARELITTGAMTLPMPPGEAQVCRDVKRGMVTFERALVLASDLERGVQGLFDRGETPLPREPDVERLEAWLHNVYLREMTR